jgi:dTDP-glucose 4,6-dehydratase
MEGKPLPVYGDGKNVRDWLFVEDHCEAIWNILRRGRVGETYNVGGGCEKQNLEVVQEVCAVIEELRPSSGRAYRDLVTFIKDRPGHDRRYAIDSTKIRTELGWSPRHDFPSGLRATIAWYFANSAWIDGVRSGDYQRWIERNYARRSAP